MTSNASVLADRIGSHPLVLGKDGITLDVLTDAITCTTRDVTPVTCAQAIGGKRIPAPVSAQFGDGARELCLVNGDFSRKGENLRKIVHEQADCVVVYPN